MTTEEKNIERANLDLYLKPTFVIDSDSKVIMEKATFLTEECKSQKEKVKELFYFVRDKIKYTPYPSFSIPYYRASETLQRGEGFCVQKAVVLTALARAVGIPSRLGFADIRNHIVPEQLREMMGTNIFVYHGYSELWLGNKWVKATPAFNIEMCNKFDIKPVEFGGVTDAMLHKRNKKGEIHIEYLKYHGTFADLPFKEIMQAFFDQYPLTRARRDLERLMRELKENLLVLGNPLSEYAISHKAQACKLKVDEWNRLRYTRKTHEREIRWFLIKSQEGLREDLSKLYKNIAEYNSSIDRLMSLGELRTEKHFRSINPEREKLYSDVEEMLKRLSNLYRHPMHARKGGQRT